MILVWEIKFAKNTKIFDKNRYYKKPWGQLRHLRNLRHISGVIANSLGVLIDPTVFYNLYFVKYFCILANLIPTLISFF